MTISKHIKKAHQMGKYLIDTDNDHGICAFGLVTTANRRDMGDYPKRTNAPCHAALTHMSDGDTPVWMADMLYPSDLPRKTKEMWIQYLIDESPYRYMFKDKSALTILRRGYAIYTTNVDGNILAAGSVAVRMLSEMPEIPEAFKVLRDFNVDPNLAFLTAHMVITKRNGKEFAVNGYSEEGHVSVVPAYMDEKAVRNFVSDEYSGPGIYAEQESYRGFNNMWSFERDDYEDDNPAGNFNRVIHEEWMKVVKDVKPDVDMPRKALFNHEWNYNENERQEYVSTKEGMPVLATILNNYWEKLHA